MAKFASLEQQRENYRLRAENAEKRAESAEEAAEYWNKAYGNARSRLKNCASIIADHASDWNSIENLETYGFAESVGESFWEEAKKARAQKEGKLLQLQQQKPKGPRRGF